MKILLRLNPALPDLLARMDIGITAFADQATVSRATVFALLNPSQHPERHLGGMRRTTAWRLAKAYASAAGIDEETSYSTIILEDGRDAVNQSADHVTEKQDN